MKRVNDPSAGVVGRIFLEKLGIKTPKEISYKSGVGVVDPGVPRSGAHLHLARFHTPSSFTRQRTLPQALLAISLSHADMSRMA